MELEDKDQKAFLKDKEYNKKWRESNKDKLKEYRLKNREHILETTRKWRLKNKDRLKAKRKEWYKTHREYANEKTRAYHNKNKEFCAELTKKWKKDNWKDYTNNRRIQIRKRTYGITQDDFNKLLEEQNYSCAICKKPFTDENKNRGFVDHDHYTDKVRGLLCSSCNLGLGTFKDDILYLESAIEYLRRFK